MHPFPELISLTDGPDGVALAPPSPEADGRTYGGLFLAQAVAAARRTVEPDRAIHSLHAMFLRHGDVDVSTRYAVETIRDGRSFSARQVSADQHGREVFRMLASFHVPEDGLTYQADEGIDVAGLPGPDEAPVDYTAYTYALLDGPPGSWAGEVRPIDIRYLNPPEGRSGPPNTDDQLMWMRIVGDLPEDPAVHEAGLAYLADATLVDHVLLPHGYRWQDERFDGTSLDHAMWFHRPARADAWLLYHQRVAGTGGARGMVIGRFHTPDGTLIASCGQEGLMRWNG
ncbi:MAG: acyl-CoA thioesterase [Acidimicrobiales bacterium]